MSALVCDTSCLFAFFDGHDPNHDSAAEAISSEHGPFVVSPFVLAELDHLTLKRRGARLESEVLRELASSAWDLPAFEAVDLTAARAVIDDYMDQQIGVADASIVILAGRYKTDRIWTLDQRHFRVLRTLAGGPFTLLPI